MVRPVKATRARHQGLIHLAEDKCDLGVTLEADDTGLNHFVAQIASFTGTFAHTAEMAKPP